MIVETPGLMRVAREYSSRIVAPVVVVRATADKGSRVPRKTRGKRGHVEVVIAIVITRAMVLVWTWWRHLGIWFLL